MTKRKVKKWLCIILLSMTALSFVGIGGWLYLNVKRLRKPIECKEEMVDICPSPEAPSTPEPGSETLEPVKEKAIKEKIEDANKSENTKERKKQNIDVYLLYGLDSRRGQLNGSRSDVILFFVLDWDKNEVRLVSMQRDILLEIPGKGLNRINAGFAWGGVELALETIAHNFGITPDNVFVVNFKGVMKIIDQLGGVEIDVKGNDINQWTIDAGLKNPGEKTLNGEQALAYMRNRNGGQGDFGRTQRQRNVVKALLENKNNWTLKQILNVVQTIPDYFYTDMSELSLVALCSKVLDMEESHIEQISIPLPGSYTFASYKGMSIIDMDFSKNKQALHDFIYDGDPGSRLQGGVE